jgi:hypothetical protein
MKMEDRVIPDLLYRRDEHASRDTELPALRAQGVRVASAHGRRAILGVAYTHA